MTLFKNDDTLEIIYKLFQACSYFFHQNKTEITQTLDDSETTVPSSKAVSTGLSGKVAKTDIVKTIDSSNNTALDKVPSCAAVATYIAELGLSSLSQKPTYTQTANSITVSVTSKIGAVKVTSIDSFNQSKVVYNSNPAATTLTVNNLSPNTSYFVEVYNFEGQPFKAQRITTLAENSGV